MSRLSRHLLWAIFCQLLFTFMGERKVSLLRRKMAGLYLVVFCWDHSLKIDLKSAGAGAASAISKKNSKTSPSQSCIGQSEKSPWDRRTEIRVLVLVYCPYSISWPLYVLTFNSDRKVSSRLVPLPFLQTEPSTVGTWWAASGVSALSACICSGCPILREMMTHGCLRL